MNRGLLLLFIFLFFFALERFQPQMDSSKRSKKHDGTNIKLGIINTILGRLIAIFTVYSVALFLEKNNLGLFNMISLNKNLILLLEILLLDLINYTWHRLLHNINFLRRFHNVHHTDKFLNSTSALRFHVIEIFFGNIFRLVPIAILGIGVEAVLMYEVILNSNVYFHHSNIKIPINLDIMLSKVIVTPYLHRIHHSIKYRESNSNYSSFLIIWDKIFRSFTPQGEVSTPKYGIPGYNEEEAQKFYFLLRQPFLNFDTKSSHK
ncbi:sterol desaturase family protein [uncultured Ilyobacter sp.]|uniref:sterol desaturase family protein n=1 Tax=uncultured Ilyobacter sp. TaxID=544433 RepID=UPI0029F58E20|nr:sterol desaturase family protein [uncultured Ilyobacter sp.]